MADFHTMGPPAEIIVEEHDSSLAKVVGRTARKETRRVLKKQRLARMVKLRPFYTLILLSFILLVIFRYIPIYGVTIAFKEFDISRGILLSPWNNFKYFRWLFEDPFFGRVLFNTIWLSLLRLVFAFPCPILLALLLNEVRHSAFKRTIQSISYLPHFISWIILGGIIKEILSPQRGAIAYIFSILGRTPINLLTEKATFRGLLVATGIWQGMGWGSIVYLAALSSIDPSLYESAEVDGANRLRQAIHITIPSLTFVMTIIFLMTVSRILRQSFEQIFNLYNPLVYEVADVLETYIFRQGIVRAEYSYTTAVGLFQNVVGVIVLIIVNQFIKRISDYSIW